MNILSVQDLKKYYQMGENTVKALDGVNLDIKEGEFLAIVGTSGSENPHYCTCSVDWTILLLEKF